MTYWCLLYKKLTHAADCFSCGKKNPNGLWFYPDYGKASCYEKPLSEFDKYDTEKYVTKNSCCMTKFSGNILACCENGGGECTATGNPLYLPNWSDQKCEERDSTLVSGWEIDWVSYSIEECCEECEFLRIKTYINDLSVLIFTKKLIYMLLIPLDFPWDET